MENLLALMLFIAALSNAIMDTIRYNWDGSLFSYIPENTFLYQWMNFRESQKNKYFLNKYRGNSGFINFLISIGTILTKTVFVPLTDLWHFCKFIMLNSFFLIIINEGSHYNLGSVNVLCALLILNLIWGIMFEGVTLGLKFKSKNKK